MISDPRGTVLGVGRGGRSNYHNVGLARALASLRAAFQEAAAGAGLKAAGVHACFGLAGLDSPEDLRAMTDGIQSVELGKGARDDMVVNDWRTAVAGAFVDDPGVTLIAGTGCVAAAQSARGRKVVRVGGWGHIVDDRGSAYDIGRDALYAAMRDYDGRGPKTSLLPLLQERMGVAEPQGIIARVYAGHMSVSGVASLSTIVAQAAQAGDAVALKILRDKARTLGELVVSAASRLDLLGRRFGVSFNGGVFKAGPSLVEPLLAEIRESAPLAEVVEPKLSPACGAVLLLMRRDGKVPDARTVERIRESLAHAE